MSGDVALFHNPQWQSSFFTSLEEMWRTKLLCDATIISKQGTEHKVHSIVLAAASNIFRERLADKQLSFRIIWTDKDDSLWNLVLQFLYTGCLYVPHRHQRDLQALCEEYSIEPLLCARALKLTDEYKNGNHCNFNSNCFDVNCFQEKSVSCQSDVQKNGNYDHVTPIKVEGSNKLYKNHNEDKCDERPNVVIKFSSSNNVITTTNDVSANESVDDSHCNYSSNVLSDVEGCDDEQEDGHIIRRETCINPRMQLWKRPPCKSTNAWKKSGVEQIDWHVPLYKQCKENVDEPSNLQDSNSQEINNPEPADLVPVSPVGSSLLPSDLNDVARCPKCNGIFKTASFRRHKYWCKGIDRAKLMLQQHVKAYCNECGQAFMSKKGLKFHLLWHKGEKPAKCTVCSATFRQAGYLKEHMRSHTGERPEICPVCQKGFFNKSALKRHSLIHTRSDPYECDQCSATFAQRRGLQCHITTVHTAQKVHQCTICNSMFCSRGSLRKHIRKKHPGSTLPSMVGLDRPPIQTDESSAQVEHEFLNGIGSFVDEDEEDDDLSLESSPELLEDSQDVRNEETNAQSEQNSSYTSIVKSKSP